MKYDSNPGRNKRFLCSPKVHSGSVAQWTGGGDLSPGVERPGREVDHSSPISADVFFGK